MRFYIIRADSVSMKKFIEFWSDQYDYGKEDLYVNNIGKKLTENRIIALFEWKNGMRLSGPKLQSVRKNFIKNSDYLPKKTNIDLLRKFLNKPGGAIWLIFWLHCQRPEEYPIYDRNVHRAMASIKLWNEIEIPSSNRMKVEIYLDHYLPFWKEFSRFEARKVDKALWSYGDFLGLEYEISVV